jgi:sulfite reductase alpha subunit-like flavoprotein
MSKGGRNDNAKGSPNYSFSVDLCVAVVKGKTRLGRHYHGLCSEFLSRMIPTDDEQANVHVWIRPGTFGKLPLGLRNDTSAFEVPIICVGSGTGIAPMRSIMFERSAVWSESVQSHNQQAKYPVENDNILVFGCRKRKADYYYEHDWQALCQSSSMRLLNAFSRDQVARVYVQKVLREADNRSLIAHHILEKGGAIYIAGGPKMARAVKEEIIEALSEKLGGEKQANQLLNKLQRAGHFSIEAWS